MALTEYQRSILALLASRRIAKQESYLAGGAALIAATDSRRLSRDIDLFHDTKEALLATWEEDRRILSEDGYRVEVPLSSPRSWRPLSARTPMRWSSSGQWTARSVSSLWCAAPSTCPALHPFDLATNKTLALIGRLEPRDWVDLISCHDRIQHLGLLSWAACGKDPGTNPSMILNEAGRSGRYTQAEMDSLWFDGGAPDAAALSARWKAMLAEARDVIAALPPAEVGTCVLDAGGGLYHEIRGAWRKRWAESR